MTVSSEKSPRIWELDALRGLLIFGMFLSHLCFYIDLFILPLALPEWLSFIFHNGGVLFIVLSGLCATLGRRSFRRGVIVFCLGLLFELGSYLLVYLNVLPDTLVIRFGVLHLLGACMMLYPLLKRLPDAVLLTAGILIVALGYWMNTLTVGVSFLYPFGLMNASFYSADYFPLLPHLGWFCIGIMLGRRCYREKKTLLPRVNERFFLLRFLRLCGRHSLAIYVLHIPVIIGICYVLSLL